MQNTTAAKKKSKSLFNETNMTSKEKGLLVNQDTGFRKH